MPDDKHKTGSPDNKRINIHEPYEVETAAKRNHVTHQQVIDAVKVVGTSTHAVDQYLQTHHNK